MMGQLFNVTIAQGHVRQLGPVLDIQQPRGFGIGGNYAHAAVYGEGRGAVGLVQKRLCPFGFAWRLKVNFRLPVGYQIGLGPGQPIA